MPDKTSVPLETILQVIGEKEVLLVQLRKQLADAQEALVAAHQALFEKKALEDANARAGSSPACN